jgi:site-specific recombinase XerD
VGLNKGAVVPSASPAHASVWASEPATTAGRHNCASWLMMRGGSLQALKELLGHADLKTSLIYAI